MNATEMKHTRLPSQEEVEKPVKPLAVLLCGIGSPEFVRYQIMAAVDRWVNEDNRLTRNWIGNRASRRRSAMHC